MDSLRDSNRNLALALGALMFTMVKSGLPAQWAGDWLATLWPTLPFAVSGPYLKMLQAVAEAVGLVTFIRLLESIALAHKARGVLGEWVYHSSASNWGHARLSVDLLRARLRYEVDLYEQEADLRRSLEQKTLVNCIGHGKDRFAFVSTHGTKIWYGIPEYRKSETFYPSRQGVLTLETSNQAGSLSARWERIGAISVSMDGRSATRDRSKISDGKESSGSFSFFITKDRYLSRTGPLTT